MPEKVVLFANPNSPHVSRWIHLLSLIGIKVKVYHCEKKCFRNDIEEKRIFPYLGILRYFISGIVYRLFHNGSDDGVYHAHSSSGYGLFALLSGENFILTTYGTEIFRIGEKETLYKKVIRRVLKRATSITTTSVSMNKQLLEKFPFTRNKIKSFSMGVDNSTFTYKDSQKSLLKEKFSIRTDDTVWFSNRRITPIYNTDIIISAFQRFYKEYSTGHLILLCDDSDSAHLAKMIGKANESPENITFLKEHLSPSEMADLLSLADYAISIPNSDQLSASILEAMACKAVPILNPLISYSELIEEKLALTLNELSVDNLFKVLEESHKRKNKYRNELADSMVKYIDENHSDSVVIERIKELYRHEN